MGPTNTALVNLFQADRKLREATSKYDSASHSVRVQARRIQDLTEQLNAAQSHLREEKVHAAEMDGDLKAREQRIEQMRQRQQEAKNHKEYQAFLTQINTEKVDHDKLEEEALKVMEGVEKSQAAVTELTAQIAAETEKHEATKAQLADKLALLQADVDRFKPIRDEAAKAVPDRLVDMFDRLADRYDGEPMAAVGKPDARCEEYICTACNMSLVPDTYNRLVCVDVVIECPNCARLLFVPAELTPEVAINSNKEPEKKVRVTKKKKAKKVVEADDDESEDPSDEVETETAVR